MKAELGKENLWCPFYNAGTSMRSFCPVELLYPARVPSNPAGHDGIEESQDQVVLFSQDMVV